MFEHWGCTGDGHSLHNPAYEDVWLKAGYNVDMLPFVARWYLMSHRNGTKHIQTLVVFHSRCNLLLLSHSTNMCIDPTNIMVNLLDYVLIRLLRVIALGWG